MNWKSSLSGALLVAVIGVVVGFAVGGKKTTSTRTVTVDATVTRTVGSVSTPTGSGPTNSGTPSTPTSTAPPAGAGQQFYSDYLGNQGNNVGNNATNASLDNNPGSLQLRGQTYQHAVAFDLSNNTSQAATETIQLPVAGLKHFSSPAAGLATDNSAKASYKLTIYKDNDGPGAVKLYSGTFNGPSGTHSVSFDTKGATVLIFDWVEPSSGEPEYSDQFIFADPIVS